MAPAPGIQDASRTIADHPDGVEVVNRMVDIRQADQDRMSGAGLSGVTLPHRQEPAQRSPSSA
jgi:hypothetical protein